MKASTVKKKVREVRKLAEKGDFEAVSGKIEKLYVETLRSIVAELSSMGGTSPVSVIRAEELARRALEADKIERRWA